MLIVQFKMQNMPR